MGLDLKNLGNRAGKEEAAPVEEIAAVAAVSEPTAEAVPEARKPGLNLRKLAARPMSESVPDEPASAPASEPVVAPNAAAGSSNDDLASLITPKSMLSLEEASPTVGAQPAAASGGGEVPVADGPTAPTADAAPDGDAPSGETPAPTEKTAEELEEEARAAALASSWSGISSVVGTMAPGRERDALQERIAIAKREEAEREARKAGLGKDDARSAARGGGGGGGLGSLLRGSSGSDKTEARRNMLGRFLDSRGIGNQPNYPSIRGAVLRVKGRELAAAPVEIGRRADELAGKLGEFNSHFVTAATASWLRRFASDDGKSMDEYLSAMRADPTAEKFKPGLEEARRIMSLPALAGSWAEVEAAKERLSRTATKAGDDLRSMVKAFPDRIDGEAEGAKLSEAIDGAAAKVPQPVFEDPEKGKLKEMFDGLKERLDEIMKQVAQAVSSIFGRK